MRGADPSRSTACARLRSSRDRSPFLPEVETAREAGLGEIDSYSWFAVALPKGTPPDIVEKMNAAVSDSLDTPAVQERLRTLAVLPKIGRAHV